MQKKPKKLFLKILYRHEVYGYGFVYHQNIFLVCVTTNAVAIFRIRSEFYFNLFCVTSIF